MTSQNLSTEPSPRRKIAEGVIMKIGEWKTRSVFERYAIVNPTHIADEARSA